MTSLEQGRELSGDRVHSATKWSEITQSDTAPRLPEGHSRARETVQPSNSETTWPGGGPEHDLVMEELNRAEKVGE